MKILTSAIIVIVILVFLLLGDSHASPYSGKYFCESNNNVILELEKNDKFILIGMFGKNTESVYGKYSVEDNKITLISNNDNPYFYGNKYIKGNIDGSRISFSDFGDKYSSVFYKQ